MRSTSAMRHEGNVYYLPRPAAQAAAIGRLHKHHEFIRASFYGVTGMLIGLALANLPSIAKGLVAAVHFVPPHVL